MKVLIILGLMGVVNILWAADPLAVRFGCELTGQTPYEKCHLVPWQHELEILALADLGLEKEVVYQYQGDSQCPPHVNLKLDVGTQSAEFSLQGSEHLSFVIPDGPSTAVLTDVKPDRTSRLRFSPLCQGTFTVQQHYELNSLQRKAQSLSAELENAAEIIRLTKAVLQSIGLSTDLIQERINELQDQIDMLTLDMAEATAANQAILARQIAFKIKVKRKLVEVKNLDKDQRQVELNNYQQRLTEMQSQGEASFNQSLRLLSYLSDDLVEKPILAHSIETYQTEIP